MKKIRARTLCMPNIFDQRQNLFGVANGVIDLETGKFFEHSPDFLISLKSPVKFDPKAECPEFINFLWRSLGNIDDILTVLDMFVAMATMSTWEYFVAMIGPGSNGKSVLESAITTFFGPDQVTEVELSELNSNQFIRAAIRRKRVLINSEVQGTKMESRWIKMISGGTMIDSDLKTGTESTSGLHASRYSTPIARRGFMITRSAFRGGSLSWTSDILSWTSLFSRGSESEILSSWRRSRLTRNYRAC